MINFIELVPKAFRTTDPVDLDRCIEEPLLLEDLIHSNFRLTRNGIGGFDLLEAEHALDLYGKFHAIGLRFCEKKVDVNQDHEKLLRFKFMNFLLGSEIFKDTVENGIKTLIKWMESKEDYHETCHRLKFLLKDQKYQKIALDLFKEGEAHELQIIQHGDARGSNIFFKYAEETKEPINMKLVDFQFSCFFCPFWDLVYFLSQNLKADLLEKNLTNLVGR